MSEPMNTSVTEETNYSKGKMGDLQTNIGINKKAYYERVNELTQDINNIHNFWVEGDPNAEALYQQLLSQYNRFKQDLEEGFSLMTEFENQVGDQIDRYASAENKIGAEL